MSFAALRDKIVAKGIISVHATETRPCRLRGCLDGFAICKRLNSVEEFESEIEAREPELQELREQLRQKKKSEEDYWAFRCATVQIEWTFEILKVGYPERYKTVSLRAKMKFYEHQGNFNAL